MSATSRSRRKWFIGGGVILLLLVIVGVALFALRGQTADEAAAAEPGEIVAAFRGDLAESATASGVVSSRQEATLSAASPGIVTELYVRAGDTVAAGDLLVQLDETDLASRLTSAQQNLTLQEANLAALQEGAAAADIAAAEAAVQSAASRLTSLLDDPSPQDLASWEADIRSQEANVASANASLSATLSSVDAAAVESARAQVASAEIALRNAEDVNEANPTGATDEALADARNELAVAQANLNALLAGPNADDVGASAASVSAAQANLDRTLANYDAFLAGATPAQIANAEAGLAQAQASLDNLLAGPTEEELAIAAAQIEQAQIALVEAEAALADATIRAPFAGIVTAVNFVEGELASGPIVTLMATDFVVQLNVDEIDIGMVAAGQPANVTLETWPEQAITAEVTEIAPRATISSNGLVTYEVWLQLGATELPVRAGMTANAEMVTANRDDVLLVPNGAIRADRENGRYFVNLASQAADGSTTFTEVEVTIGLRDNDFTQITSGISAGDELLIGELAVPEQQFTGPFGGGN